MSKWLLAAIGKAAGRQEPSGRAETSGSGCSQICPWTRSGPARGEGTIAPSPFKGWGGVVLHSFGSFASSEAYDVGEEGAEVGVERLVMREQFLGRAEQGIAPLEPLAHAIERDAHGLDVTVGT